MVGCADSVAAVAEDEAGRESARDWLGSGSQLAKANSETTVASTHCLQSGKNMINNKDERRTQAVHVQRVSKRRRKQATEGIKRPGADDGKPSPRVQE